MIDWKNARPNARYWVLRLLVDHFHPGDQLVGTTVDGAGDVFAQAFITPSGKTLLVINKRNRLIAVALPEAAAGGVLTTVDAATGEDPPRRSLLANGTLALSPFAVATISIR
jgi:hypothetical protein